MLTALVIIIALLIYAAFYFTHGKYLEKNVFKADPSRETPARKFYDGIDYVPANKYVLYGHHFASIAGAGPIVGPAIALAWGWLPVLLWVWFGNVFIGVVHDYLSLCASVRYDARSIAWIAGKLMGRHAFYAFNLYIWFALLLVYAAFAYVISALFAKVGGAATAAIILIALAPVVGILMYRTKAGFKGGTLMAIISIIIAIAAGYYLPIQLTQQQWIIVLAVYAIIAASLPVWVLLQPRDYMNAFILWTSLAIGGLALITCGFIGKGAFSFPAVTSLTAAKVVGGQPSPFWPTIPLVVACGALSGFHSLVGSGTSSKQLANELDALFVGYAGMLTEGFLSTMVIGCLAAFGFSAFSDIAASVATNKKVMALVGKALGIPYLAKAVNIKTINTTHALVVYKVGEKTAQMVVPIETLKNYYLSLIRGLENGSIDFGKVYAGLAGAVKWVIIPRSYALATNTAFGLDVKAMTIFGTLWITGFALTSLDTGTRLARFAWQELFMGLKDKAPSLYKVLANRWVASIVIVVLGSLLAWGGAFLVIWPAFSGMNQLLASLALMTVSVWVIKVQKAPTLGKILTVAPAVFLWVTVTVALIWYLAVVVPATAATKPFTASVVGIATAIGLALNLYLFALWISSLRKKEI